MKITFLATLIAIFAPFTYAQTPKTIGKWDSSKALSVLIANSAVLQIANESAFNTYTVADMLASAMIGFNAPGSTAQSSNTCVLNKQGATRALLDCVLKTNYGHPTQADMRQTIEIRYSLVATMDRDNLSHIELQNKSVWVVKTKGL